jgi:membrane-anchored protein YejM (alkaline phosphatase superfamily)
LVEAGATFVTVQYSGWDHHWDLKAGYESLLPIVDSAVATLFRDLDQRGLLETTLVVL